MGAYGKRYAGQKLHAWRWDKGSRRTGVKGSWKPYVPGKRRYRKFLKWFLKRWLVRGPIGAPLPFFEELIIKAGTARRGK